MPSILGQIEKVKYIIKGFKPCYKRNTFNTQAVEEQWTKYTVVLNLIMTGMSSIHWYNNFDFYTKWIF